MPAELVFARAATLDELEPREWDALVERLPRPTPFLLYGWLRAWWPRYGGGRSLEIHLARRDGRLLGALPLQVGRRAGIRVAEWIGGMHAQLADVLLAPDAPRELPRDLLENAVARADLVDLGGLPAQSPLAPHGMRLIERVEAPVVDLGGGWETLYRTRLSSKRRSQHRKRLRDAAAAGRLRIRIVREPGELGAALDEAVRLHALRWTGRRDASIYALPGAVAFHREVLHALGPRARIALLELDERAVAYRYGLRVGPSLVGNGIGFDPAYRELSPGWLLLLAALEDAAAEGIRTVELLGGDEPYKLQLADPRPLHSGLRAGSAPGRAALEARVAAIRLRRRLKRSAAARRLYERARLRSIAAV